MPIRRVPISLESRFLRSARGNDRRSGSFAGADELSIADVGGRIRHDPVSTLHAVADVDRCAAITSYGELADVNDVVVDHGDAKAQDDGL
jgi:hypothetical protein